VGKPQTLEVGLDERQYSDKGQSVVSGESGREQKAKFLLRTLSGHSLFSQLVCKAAGERR